MFTSNKQTKLILHKYTGLTVSEVYPKTTGIKSETLRSDLANVLDTSQFNRYNISRKDNIVYEKKEFISEIEQSDKSPNYQPAVISIITVFCKKDNIIDYITAGNAPNMSLLEKRFDEDQYNSDEVRKIFEQLRIESAVDDKKYLVEFVQESLKAVINKVNDGEIYFSENLQSVLNDYTDSDNDSEEFNKLSEQDFVKSMRLSECYGFETNYDTKMLENNGIEIEVPTLKFVEKIDLPIQKEENTENERYEEFTIHVSRVSENTLISHDKEFLVFDQNKELLSDEKCILKHWDSNEDNEEIDFSYMNKVIYNEAEYRQDLEIINEFRTAQSESEENCRMSSKKNMHTCAKAQSTEISRELLDNIFSAQIVSDYSEYIKIENDKITIHNTVGNYGNFEKNPAKIEEKNILTLSSLIFNSQHINNNWGCNDKKLTIFIDQRLYMFSRKKDQQELDKFEFLFNVLLIFAEYNQLIGYGNNTELLVSQMRMFIASEYQQFYNERKNIEQLKDIVNILVKTHSTDLNQENLFDKISKAPIKSNIFPNSFECDEYHLYEQFAFNKLELLLEHHADTIFESIDTLKEGHKKDWIDLMLVTIMVQPFKQNCIKKVKVNSKVRQEILLKNTRSTVQVDSIWNVRIEDLMQTDTDKIMNAVFTLSGKNEKRTFQEIKYTNYDTNNYYKQLESIKKTLLSDIIMRYKMLGKQLIESEIEINDNIKEYGTIVDIENGLTNNKTYIGLNKQMYDIAKKQVMPTNMICNIIYRRNEILKKQFVDKFGKLDLSTVKLKECQNYFDKFQQLSCGQLINTYVHNTDEITTLNTDCVKFYYGLDEDAQEIKKFNDILEILSKTISYKTKEDLLICLDFYFNYYYLFSRRHLGNNIFTAECIADALKYQILKDLGNVVDIFDNIEYQSDQNKLHYLLYISHIDELVSDHLLSRKLNPKKEIKKLDENETEETKETCRIIVDEKYYNQIQFNADFDNIANKFKKCTMYELDERFVEMLYEYCFNNKLAITDHFGYMLLKLQGRKHLNQQREGKTYLSEDTIQLLAEESIKFTYNYLSFLIGSKVCMFENIIKNYQNWMLNRNDSSELILYESQTFLDCLFDTYTNNTEIQLSGGKVNVPKYIESEYVIIKIDDEVETMYKLRHGIAPKDIINKHIGLNIENVNNENANYILQTLRHHFTTDVNTKSFIYMFNASYKTELILIANNLETIEILLKCKGQLSEITQKNVSEQELQYLLEKSENKYLARKYLEYVYGYSYKKVDINIEIKDAFNQYSVPSMDLYNAFAYNFCEQEEDTSRTSVLLYRISLFINQQLGLTKSSYLKNYDIGNMYSNYIDDDDLFDIDNELVKRLIKYTTLPECVFGQENTQEQMIINELEQFKYIYVRTDIRRENNCIKSLLVKTIDNFIDYLEETDKIPSLDLSDSFIEFVYAQKANIFTPDCDYINSTSELIPRTFSLSDFMWKLSGSGSVIYYENEEPDQFVPICNSTDNETKLDFNNVTIDKISGTNRSKILKLMQENSYLAKIHCGENEIYNEHLQFISSRKEHNAIGRIDAIIEFIYSNRKDHNVYIMDELNNIEKADVKADQALNILSQSISLYENQNIRLTKLQRDILDNDFDVIKVIKELEQNNIHKNPTKPQNVGTILPPKQIAPQMKEVE